MASSDYLEQRLIDTVLNSGGEFSFAAPTNVYIALFTTATDDADAIGVEVSGVDYARIDSGAFDTMTGVTDGHTQNSAEIAFAQAGAGGWGLVKGIGLYDAVSGGNLLYHGALTADKQVDENDTFKIAIGDLDLTLS